MTTCIYILGRRRRELGVLDRVGGIQRPFLLWGHSTRGTWLPCLVHRPVSLFLLTQARLFSFVTVVCGSFFFPLLSFILSTKSWSTDPEHENREEAECRIRVGMGKTGAEGGGFSWVFPSNYYIYCYAYMYFLRSMIATRCQKSLRKSERPIKAPGHGRACSVKNRGPESTKGSPPITRKGIEDCQHIYTLLQTGHSLLTHTCSSYYYQAQSFYRANYGPTNRIYDFTPRAP